MTDDLNATPARRPPAIGGVAIATGFAPAVALVLLVAASIAPAGLLASAGWLPPQGLFDPATPARAVAGLAFAGVVFAAIVALAARALPGLHPHPRVGLANQVTLFRAGLAALLAGLALAPAGRDWILFGIAAAAAALDLVDGAIARGRGEASDYGARLDMESDAFATLVLCVLLWRLDVTGAWVLAAGLMRYAFVAAALRWRWLAAPLPFSQRRRLVCGIQVVALVGCLAPALPIPAAGAVAAASLALLGWSFAVDVVALHRRDLAQATDARQLPAARAQDPPVPSTAGRLRTCLLALGLPLLLNAAMSFESLWPTPAVKPVPRIAPEFGLLWLALLLVGALRDPARRRVTAALAALLGVYVVGRYVEVTIPALFGRPLDWYWDGRQLPNALAQLTTAWPPALTLAAIGAAVLVLWGGYRLLRALLAATLRHSVPLARRSRIGVAATLALWLLIGANLAGLQATWAWVSRPVVATWWQQGRILWHALSPDRLADLLPPSPAFESDLAALRGHDLYLVFAESYGAATLDVARLSGPMRPHRERLLASLARQGVGVVSARVRSPTFAGGSWLAHAALLGGIDTTDPARYHLLLTTDRDNLVRLFGRQGYRTIGLMPGLRLDWPEGRFYRYDRLLDSAALDYEGPAFGYWRIPDQFSLARLDAIEPASAARAPRLVVFPTINSHIPFRPLPPYQPDVARLLGPQPYDPADLPANLSRSPDWLNLDRPYVASIGYTYRWLADLVARAVPAGATVLLLGDHQPAATVTGPDQPWDVPVHLISGDPALLARFRGHGFVDGLEPAPPAIGAMHGLTRILLAAFSGAPDSSPPCLRGRPAGCRTGETDSEDRSSPARSCPRSPCRSAPGAAPSASRRRGRRRSAVRRSTGSTGSARRCAAPVPTNRRRPTRRRRSSRSGDSRTTAGR